MTDKTFEEQIAGLAEKSKQAVENRFSEAQTNLTVIQPFIAALGYNLHNFHEVETEFHADIGDRKGEKVDFALKIGGHVTILIEAKSAREQLNDFHRNQLFRYFAATDVKIAILTNGREAWFYADIDKDNVMDINPFFKFNFQQHSKSDIEKLRQFQKNAFDISAIIEIARAIKNSEKLEKHIKEKIINPDEEFTKFIVKAISGKTPEGDSIPTFQKSIKEIFTSIIAEKTSMPIIEKLNSPMQSVNQWTDNTTSSTHLINSQDFEEKYGKFNNFETIREGPMKSVFLRYVEKICSFGSIEKTTNKSYPVYLKNGTFFACVEFQKKFFNIFLPLNARKELPDPKGVLRNNSRHSYINVDENSDHDYIFELIKQAYDRR